VTSPPPRPLPEHWRLDAEHTLDLRTPRVMGIVNTTPDSFYAGSRSLDPHACAQIGLQMIADGADLLDIGGESTRPGAQRINADEQIARTVPAIESLRAAGVRAPISIDTTQSAVASAALDAGANIINDVSAGTEDPEMFGLCAQRSCGLVLMHRLRRPAGRPRLRPRRPGCGSIPRRDLRRRSADRRTPHAPRRHGRAPLLPASRDRCR